MNLIEKLDESEKVATPGPWQEDLGNWDIERIDPREAIAQFSFEHRGAFDEGDYGNKVHPYL